MGQEGPDSGARRGSSLGQDSPGNGVRRGSLVGLIVGVTILVPVTVLLWMTTVEAADRLVLAVLSTAVLIGIAGRFGASPQGSRVPAAAQGVVVGAAIATAASALLLGDFGMWGMLWVLLALPSLFPAVLPPSWRRVATATWADLRPEKDNGGSDRRGRDG